MDPSANDGYSVLLVYVVLYVYEAIAPEIFLSTLCVWARKAPPAAVTGGVQVSLSERHTREEGILQVSRLSLSASICF